MRGVSRAGRTLQSQSKLESWSVHAILLFTSRMTVLSEAFIEWGY
jgi:hypothetical protein